MDGWMDGWMDRSKIQSNKGLRALLYCDFFLMLYYFIILNYYNQFRESVILSNSIKRKKIR